MIEMVNNYISMQIPVSAGWIIGLAGFVLGIVVAITVRR